MRGRWWGNLWGEEIVWWGESIRIGGVAGRGIGWWGCPLKSYISGRGWVYIYMNRVASGTDD